MFIRWERSNVRENIMMSKFAFGDFREGKSRNQNIIVYAMAETGYVLSANVINAMVYYQSYDVIH